MRTSSKSGTSVNLGLIHGLGRGFLERLNRTLVMGRQGGMSTSFGLIYGLVDPQNVEPARVPSV